jgi:hypothetical protein
MLIEEGGGTATVVETGFLLVATWWDCFLDVRFSMENMLLSVRSVVGGRENAGLSNFRRLVIWKYTTHPHSQPNMLNPTTVAIGPVKYTVVKVM